MHNKEYIRVTVKIYQEKDGRWTAECIELGTSSFGDTFEEAEESIMDMIELHLNTLAEVGELKNFLKKHKIKIHRAKPPATIRLPYSDVINAFVREYQLPILA